jgi:hypothetical protein
MRNIFERIIAFFRNLFGGTKQEPVVPTQPQPPVLTPPTPPTPPKEPTGDLEEPATSTSPVIGTFLWKPDSDTHPKGVVISISSDTLRAQDVRITFTNKNGRKMSIKNTYNAGGHLRANRLAGYKYGRFNFKPGGFPKDYEKGAPITVTFTAIIDGIEVPCKVVGRNQIVIKDVHKRLDLQ